MRIGILAAVAIGAACLAGSGCVTYRGPRGVEEQLERRMGVPLDREFGLKLGWASTKLLASIQDDDEEDPFFGDGVSGIGVAVYGVPEGAPRPRLDASSLGLDGWDTLIRSRDDGSDCLILTRSRNGEIREAIVVVRDDEEIVLARLRGHLDRTIARLASEGAPETTQTTQTTRTTP